jgi:type IV pilus assembly protein PilW
MTAQRGFTLVEAMVATLLLLLAAAMALTLVAHGRRAHRSAEARSRLEESARAALDLLAHEIRMAGFSGRLVPGVPVSGAQAAGSIAPPGLETGGGCVASLALDLAAPLAGADGTFAAAPGMPLGCRPSPAGRSVPGADTLVVRHASALPTRPDPGRLQLESTRRAGRLFADGLPVLGPAAQVNDLEVSVFYASTDSTGQPGFPSLRRKQLVGGTAPAMQDEELVTGVADLQVEADIDTTAGPGRYLPLDEVPAGTRIRAIRLWVLVQSDLPEPGLEMQPALSYANRQVPATRTRQARLLASRVVEPRNGGAGP